MKFISLLLMFVFSSAVNAADLSEATSSICAKIKSCGMTQIESQGLPPEMATMMKSLFDGMCTTMVSPYVVAAKNAGLEKKGIACLETINAMSCEELMKGDGNETEACKELERAADEAGFDVESVE